MFQWARNFFETFFLMFKMNDSISMRIQYFLYVRTPVGPWYTRKQLRRAKLAFPEGHSTLKTFNYQSFHISAIPICFDNYCYAIISRSRDTCILVDVGDSEPVIEFLDREQISPNAIFCTHKHWDHVYGNSDLLEKYPSVKIYGNPSDPPSKTNRFVHDEEEFYVGDLKFQAFFMPGHTMEHTLFQLENPDTNDYILFTGDFIFNSGCGKLFEGTPAIMQKSVDKFLTFPRNSIIFPGHEYTKENLHFVKHVADLLSDKDFFPNLNEKWEECVRKRYRQEPMLPTTIHEQLVYNPFLRTSEEPIQKIVGVQDSETDPWKKKAYTLGSLRKLKDKFAAEQAQQTVETETSS